MHTKNEKLIFPEKSYRNIRAGLALLGLKMSDFSTYMGYKRQSTLSALISGCRTCSQELIDHICASFIAFTQENADCVIDDKEMNNNNV